MSGLTKSLAEKVDGISDRYQTPTSDDLDLIKKLTTAFMAGLGPKKPPEEPKDPTQCTVFQLYRAVASPTEITALQQRYAEGIGWGEAKQTLFEKLNAQLTAPRERYQALMDNPMEIDRLLNEGEQRARELARKTLKKARKAIGIQ